MSNFEKITRKYLEEFQDKYITSQRSRSTSSELPTRPRVHKYIEDLVALCKIQNSDPYVHHDTGLVSRDRPDWTIEDRLSLGIYFFGDHKDINLRGSYQPTPGEIDQIKRYLSFGRPVFVFDGLEFIVYENDFSNSKSYPLVSKPLVSRSKWSTMQLNSQVETLFKGLLGNPGFRKWSEEDLIKQLALYAQEIRLEFEQLLEAPIGSGLNAEENFLISELRKLQTLLKEGHDLGLADSTNCASFVSQVLSFGLFYAHTNQLGSVNKPDQRAKEMLNFWQNYNSSSQNTNLRPIYEIAKLLFSVVSRPNVLSVWFREVSNFLAHADYMGKISIPLDFHTLFETFLIHFDPKTRFDKGAFYTPQELTNWMVAFVDEVSKAHFKDSFLKQAENIIDPCCGTGGFLEAIIKYSQRENSKIHGKLIGLEILPAPYALANYRMSQILTGKNFLNKDAPSIYLTDSLSDNLVRLPRVKNNPFIQEVEDASRETRPPLRVIIGNPPSTYETPLNAKRDNITAKLEDFRPPIGARSGRQNIQKALSNEAWAFLRWSAEKVIESREGIIALVLPGAFTSHISFEYARSWLIAEFDQIYVLELDEDGRRNISTKSLFNVLQGRIVMIVVLESSNSGRKKANAQIFHHDISEASLEDKKKFLSALPSISDFDQLRNGNSVTAFTPTKAFDENLWKLSWPLLSIGQTQGIFDSKCSAIKLAPSSVMFHVDSTILRRRGTDLKRFQQRSNLLIADYIERWYKGQRKPPRSDKFSTGVVNEVVKASSSSSSMRKYTYRPFVDGYVLYDEDLFKELGDSPGGGTRSRPEVRRAFEAGAIGFSVAPAPEDIGSELHRFASFTWQLPDNDLAARGNGMVYASLRATPTDTGGYKVSENINKTIKGLFTNHKEDYIFYIYAILSSNSYQGAFYGKLFSSSNPGDPIRIPILAQQADRDAITSLGRELAEFENFGATIKKPSASNFKVISNFNLGQEDFNLKVVNYDDKNEVLNLMDEGSNQISILGVTDDIYSLQISGHLVLERWLQYRKLSYLNRGLVPSDLDELLDLLERISGQFDCIAKIDKFLLKTLSVSNVIAP
jgi:hypothetical protein